MKTTKVFQSGNSQALRIPQEYRTDIKDFLISKVGDCFIAYPANDLYAPLKATIGAFPKISWKF